MTALASSIVKVSLFVFSLKNRVSGSFWIKGRSGMTGASTIGCGEASRTIASSQFGNLEPNYQETMSDCHQNFHHTLQKLLA